MANKKFSEFADGGTSRSGDVIVGLRAGVNTKFEGGYQANNNFYQADIGSGDVALTNPLPSVIYLINQLVDGRVVTLPTLLDPDSPAEGTNAIKIINAGYGSVILNNFSGNAIGGVPYGGVVELSVTSNGSEFGWYVNNPLQNYNNLSDLTNNGAARAMLGISLDYIEADCSISDVTLTNPLQNNIKITGNNPITKLILPPMNVAIELASPGSPPEGTDIWIENFSGDYQPVYADDATTLIVNAPTGAVTKITVTDNTTSNGSFEVASFPGTLPIPISVGGTGSGNLSGAQANLQITGAQQSAIWFSPANVSGAPAGQSNFSNGANYPYLQYVQSGLSYAVAVIEMPTRWDGGALSIEFPWYTPATSGDVVWFVDAAIVLPTNSLNPTFGTAQSVTSAAGSANTLIVATSPSFTPSGTAVSGSANLLVVRAYRNGGSGADDLADNAFLINQAVLNWVANVGNDI